MKKKLLVLVTFFISSACFSNQVTISNTSGSAEKPIEMNVHMNSSANAPITFTASTSQATPYDTDDAAIKCLDTDLYISDSRRLHQAIHLGDTLDASVSGDLALTGTVKSTCKDKVSTNLWLYDVIQGQEYGYYLPLDLSVASTCSVIVNTSPSFENVKPGSETNIIELTTGGTGKGTLTYTPDKIENDAGLLKNGDAHISYSVTDATWDSSKNVWTGDLSEHDLLLGAIPQNTVAGTYSGIMTVTIACE